MQKTLGGLSCEIGTRPRVMNIAIGRAPGFLPGAFAKREQTLHHFPVAIVSEEKRTRNRSRGPRTRLLFMPTQQSRPPLWPCRAWELNA